MTRVNILATLVIVEILVASHFREKAPNPAAANSTTTAIAKKTEYGGFESRMAWGEHLVTITRCNDCHSPGKTAIPGINTDNSGSSWKEEQFIDAMRQGKSRVSAGELQAMPWKEYSVMTDEELRAIFTYLKSAKPLDNTATIPASPVISE